MVKESKIILGDCKTGIKSTLDGFYDLACVDPPYGINFGNYQRNSKDKAGKRHKKKAWDKETPDDEYFSELKRVSKNQIIFGGNYFSQLCGQSPPLKTLEDFTLFMSNSDQNWLFWYKQNPAPTYAVGELAWCSFPTGNDIIDYRYYGALEGATAAGQKIHPTQKPVYLYRYIFKKFATPDFKILDTHGGSMNSVIAAMDEDISITCYETDPDYFKRAHRSIKEWQNQTGLFKPQHNLMVI